MRAQDYRKMLEERLDRLTQRFARIDDHRHHVDEQVPIEMVEQGQSVQNDPVLDRLDEATRAEIIAVRGALERVDHGTWQRCEACAGLIEPKRLEALLTTTHCARCARAVA